MWQDEIYYEDDDAAMAAYHEATRASSNDDDDDDFAPEPPTGHRGRTKSQRVSVSKKKTESARRATTNSHKPRIADRFMSSKLDTTLPSSSGEDQSNIGDEDIDIESLGDSMGVRDSCASAVPTPDIGQLKVCSSVGGSPSPPSPQQLETASATAMDTDEGSNDPSTALLALRQREQTIRARMEQLESEIAELEKKCGVEDSSDKKGRSEQLDLSEFRAPEWSVPIRANVMNFEWEKLAASCQFDVILMDPPWQLASQAPTRGVAIAYQQLPDVCIESLPIQLLQTNGFIFIWVINNKYTKAFQLMKQWGYTYVDDITWVKQTVNRRMAKGHGYYLQHAKETCLVGKKGADPQTLQRSVASDVIFSERRGQSQKPEEMYEIIEQLIPGGNYLEIFGRKNNLRDYWVTIGNEL
ncbi:MT-A70-domain-containing protein [Coemansia reversa NRRL 1564]|uniref:mRNA m(6)A methyltransferase n=1 Tax=Coemansia reversa (strain ATCC 12441 / NRRL 1564) TaxID=763665 RepID=A0A2G5BEI9_COERN|nr:MT-A70-domain-containing protein [Coemansia reversa NRRL 1564]|eukprot:PIA17424.1 MT-A70-domain-containing protein [Coemansia reversa NRRL 1564]